MTSSWIRGFDVTEGGRTRAPAGRAPTPVVEAQHGRDRLLELHREGASMATIAAALNAEGYETPRGARWHRTSVARVIAEAAYPSLVSDISTR